jgi:Cu/Ag efflux protein CusF
MNVRKAVSIVIMLLLGGVLSLALLAQAPAKEKKAKAAPKEDRVSGTVRMISKDTSTITVRKGSMDHQVVYSNETKYTKRNKPAKMEDVKEGVRVICLGKYDEKHRLVANRIDVRSETP